MHYIALVPATVVAFGVGNMIYTTVKQFVK